MMMMSVLSVLITNLLTSKIRNDPAIVMARKMYFSRR